MAFSFQPKTAGMDGLVLCLDAANTKSYPGSGTTWTDLSQTATSGSLTNGPVFSSIGNGAINFDGTDDKVTLSSTLGNNLSQLTLECWILPSFNGAGHVISKGTFGSYQYGIRVYQGDGFGGGPTSSAVIVAWQSNGNNHNTATTNFSINDSNWHHIVGMIVDNTSATIYLDGVLRDRRTNPTGSWNKTGAANAMVGARADSDGASNSFSGSISLVKMYNRTLSDAEVLQNYNATCGRFGKTPTITDLDALSFVNAASISSSTHQVAINTLVTDLKGAGLWSKMKAIYPFVGGTAASHKWNLKDPRDVDAAFRLTFTGGWSHSSNGADPNGTNSWADTFFVPANQLSISSAHFSYYSRENASSLNESGVYIGNGLFGLAIKQSNQAIGVCYEYTNNRITTANTDATGFYIGTRTNSTTFKLFKNTGQLGSTNTNSSTNLSDLNQSYVLGALRLVGSITNYGNLQCAFATIGDGLTDTDAANLYTIVQKYQTTLGRQV